MVEITDEVEAKEVGKMMQRHHPQWGHYCIGNTQAGKKLPPSFLFRCFLAVTLLICFKAAI